MGRFINADALVSTGQGLLGNNMFAYCENNPVMYSDPTGEAILEVIIGIIKERAKEAFIDGLAGAAIDGVCTFATGGSWKDVGSAAANGFGKNFMYGLIDDFCCISKINGCIAVFNTCRDSGASTAKCLAAAPISVCFSYRFSSKNDGNIGKFIDFIFGLGSDLMVSGITEGIVRNASNSVAQNAVMPQLNSPTDSIPSKSNDGFETNSVFAYVAIN